MNEESVWGRLVPWVMSMVFGAGAALGTSKVMSVNQEKRLKDLEDWQEEKGMTKEFHCAKCRAAQSESELATERIVQKAVGEMGDKILARIDRFHEVS